jgi:hypothetical protein
MSIVLEYPRKAKAALRFSHSPRGTAILLGSFFPSTSTEIGEQSSQKVCRASGRFACYGIIRSQSSQLTQRGHDLGRLTNHLCSLNATVAKGGK